MKTAPLIILWISCSLRPASLLQMPARIVKAKSDGTKMAQLGKETSLTCVYTGNPAPLVIWTKNGKKLDEKCAYCVQEVKHSYRQSTLRVTPYRDTDFGEYMCKARNHLGFGDITIKLEEDKSQNITQCLRDRILANDPRVLLEFLPRCDANGLYHKLQCSIHLDKCWCVDQSGHKIADAFDGHQGKHCSRKKQKDLRAVAVIVLAMGGVLLLLLLIIICRASKNSRSINRPI